MNKIKYGLTLIMLALILLIPYSVYASTTGSISDYITWELDSDGNLTIDGIGVIPSGTVSSDDNWGTDIKTVTINSGITGISNNMFKGCTSLTSIDLPNTLKSIGSYSFSGCTSLTKIEIPNTVTSIDTYAFSECTKLQEVRLPQNLSILGDYSFYKCIKLSTVNTDGFKNNIITSNTHAFDECVTLATQWDYEVSGTQALLTGVNPLGNVIIIPSTTDFLSTGTTIYPKGAKYGLTGLDNAKAFFSGNSSFSTSDNQQILYSHSRVNGNTYTTLTKVVDPSNTMFKLSLSGIQYVGVGALSSLSRIEEFSLAKTSFQYNYEDLESIPTLKKVTFSGITDLNSNVYNWLAMDRTDIEVYLPNVIYTSVADLSGINIKSLTLSDSFKTSFEVYETNKFSSNNITIGDWVYNTTYHYLVGYNGTDTNVTIPATVGTYIVYGVSKDALPNTITDLTIAYHSSKLDIDFTGLTHLNTLTINRVLTDVSDTSGSSSPASTYFGTLSIDELIWDNTVYTTNSSGGAFKNLIVTKVTINSNDTKYYNQFYGNPYLEEIDVSNYKYTGIWKDCVKLKNITLNEYALLYQEAFYGCTSLKEITLPNTITSLPSKCFYKCTSLETINGFVNINNFGQHSLQGCNSFDLPQGYIFNKDTVLGIHAFSESGVSNIKAEAGFQFTDYSFRDCTELQSVKIIGESDIQTLFGTYSFYGCTKLQDVDFNDNPIKLSDQCFYKTIIKELYIPDKANNISYSNSNLLPSDTIVYGKWGNIIHRYLHCNNTGGRYSSKTYSTCVFDDGEYVYTEGNYSLVVNIKDNVVTYTLTGSGTETGSSAWEWFKTILGGDHPVIIGEGVTEIPSYLITKTGTTSSNSSGNGYYYIPNIPNTVTKIGDYAFFTSIQATTGTVTIPASVEEIGVKAFYNSNNNGKNYIFKILSKDCILNETDGFSHLYSNIAYNPTIYGYTGSTSERYATLNNCTFVPLDSVDVILKVMNKSGKPISNGTWQLKVLSSTDDSELNTITLLDTTVLYDIGSVSEGSYYFELYKDSELVYTSDYNMIVTEGTVTGNSIIYDDTEKYYIKGTLRDSSNRLLRNYLISFNALYSCYTDVNGNYLIENIPSGTKGNLIVQSGKNKYPSAEMTINSNTNFNFTIPLATKDIVVKVKDKNNKAIEGAVVEVYDDNITYTNTTDSTGIVTFYYLEDKEWNIKVIVNGNTFTTTSDKLEDNTIIASAEYSLKGDVIDSSGKVSKDVTLRLTGSVSTVKTNSDGKFDFGNLYEGTYEINIYNDYGQLLGTKDVTLNSNTELHLVLNVALTDITGVVTDTSGNVVENVKVSNTELGDTLTDSNGKYEYINVIDKYYEIKIEYNDEIFNTDSDHSSTVVAHKYTISGIAYDNTGSPMEGVSIALGDNIVTSDSNGYYIFEGILNGTYGLAAIKGTYTGTAVAVIADKDCIVDIYLDIVDNTYTVSGTIKDSSGNPVPNVLVTLNSYNITSNDKGEYTINVPAGSYIVTAIKGYDLVSSNILVPNQNVCDLILDLTTTNFYKVEGIVKDYKDDIITGAAITLVGVNTITTSDGIFEFANVEENDNYTLLIDYNGINVAKIFNVRDNIYLEIKLPEPSKKNILGTLSDINNKPISNITITVKDLSTSSVLQEKITDSQGNYIFTDLLPGNYVISATVNDSVIGSVIEITQDKDGNITVDGSTDLQSLDALSTASGKVLDINNTPVAGAIVDIQNKSSNTSYIGEYSISDIFAILSEIVVKYDSLEVTTQVDIDSSGEIPDIILPIEISTEQATESTTEQITESTTVSTKESTSESTTELTSESTTEISTEVTTEGTTENTTEQASETISETSSEITSEIFTEQTSESTTEIIIESTTSNTESSTENITLEVSTEQTSDIEDVSSETSTESMIESTTLLVTEITTVFPTESATEETTMQTTTKKSSGGKGGNSSVVNDRINPSDKVNSNTDNDIDLNDITNTLLSNTDEDTIQDVDANIIKPVDDIDLDTSNKDNSYTESLDYLNGYPDQSFKPNEYIKRCEVAQLFYNLDMLDYSNTYSFSNYIDVDISSWYYKAIISTPFRGYGDNTFKPTSNMTRGEFTDLVMRTFYLIDYEQEAQSFFTDVNSTDWYSASITKAVTMGVIEGYPDGTFRPSQPVTRVEAVIILQNVFGLETGIPTTFKDISVTDWFSLK